MAIFIGTTGTDSFTGLSSEANTFRFTPATLQPADTVIGGAGTFTDILQFTAAGNFAAGLFAGVSGIERILLAAGANTLILPQALVLGAATGRLDVVGAGGADFVNASAVTNPSARVGFFTGANGNDTFLGGAGNDTAAIQGAGATRLLMGGGDDVVNANPAVLDATDSIDGGAGNDRLALTAGGSIAAGQLAGLASVEEIALAAGTATSLVVTDALAAQAGGVLAILGNDADSTVDASAVAPARAISFTAGRGADSVVGGAGADTVSTLGAGLSGSLGAGDDVLRLLAVAAGGALVSGDAGYDVIQVTVGGVHVLGEGLTGFEEVNLLVAANVTLNATPGLRVLGSEGGDRIVLGAAGQRVFGLGGNDTVVATAGTLPGSLLVGGGQATADMLRLEGAGSFDLRSPLVSGFERIQVANGGGALSILQLGNRAVELDLRTRASVTLGAQPDQQVIGSPGSDIVVFGAGGQIADGGGGNDTFRVTPQIVAEGVVVSGGLGVADHLQITTGGSPPPAMIDLFGGASAVIGIEQVSHGFIGPAQRVVIDLPAIAGLRFFGTAAQEELTMRAPGLWGSLGAGDDVVTAAGTLLDAPAGGETLDGGQGFDVVRVSSGALAGGPATIGAHLVNFELIDMAGISGTFAIAGTAAWQVRIGPLHVFDASRILVLQGGAGAEIFEGISGQVTVAGGEGDDAFVVSGAPGASSIAMTAIDGEGGADEILLVLPPGPAERSVRTMPAGWRAETITLDGLFALTTNAEPGLLVRGSPVFGDVVTLSATGQRVLGQGGNDTLRAAAAAVHLDGGAGDDEIHVLPGDADVWAAPGQTVAGAAGLDMLRIGDGGGGASGTLAIDFAAHAVTGMDEIRIGSGFALVDLRLSSAMMATANANGDALAGDLRIRSLAGNGNPANPIRFDASALGAAAVIDFGDGDRFAGADTVIGGAGGDSINGGDGADSLLGGAGNDRLIGSAGDDTILGENGNDTLSGDGGLDVIDGGAGVDVVSYAFYAAAVTVNLQAAAAGTPVTIAGGDIDVLIDIEGVEGGFGSDSLLGTFGANAIFGGSGNDTLVGGGGRDSLNGGNGADSLFGGTGGDLLVPGAGADRLLYNSPLDGAGLVAGAAEANADLVQGFALAEDVIVLARNGLAMGAAAALLKVTENGPWSMANAVIVFHGNDGLSGDDFTDFAQVQAAINVDAGPGSGSSIGRTVAMLVSNSEAAAARRTGLYIWTDGDGDALLDAGESLTLLAVFPGLVSDQFAASNFLLL